MRGRENLVRAGWKKRAKMLGISEQDAKKIICNEIQESIGSRLYEPEAEKQGNSNTGENLKKVTEESSKTAKILNCSKELVENLHEVFARIESVKFQDIEKMKFVCQKTYTLFKREFPLSNMCPSLHRALQHSPEYMEYFQKRGYSLGEMSEQGLEATNFDSKESRRRHSRRGTHKDSNVDCFHRSWWSSDLLVLLFH